MKHPNWPWVAAATLAACLATAYPAAAAPAQRPLDCGPPDYLIQCYTPQAYQTAYGIAPLLSHGTNGGGEIVALPELAESPASHGVVYTDIRQDLAAFDSRFGLPAAKLTVLNTIARSKTPYLAAIEEVEDTEIVHAIAPVATLDVVLAPQDAESSTARFAAALSETIRAGVAAHAAVISISDSAGVGDRRLPRRDGLERGHRRLRRRLQQPVPPTVLPERRRPDRRHSGRP